ncbi:hypothetical protein FNV43_RR21799 [Rhamnella rubrinervis]|uniref:BOI-related E3 ubiquitin-protein ligase 3 n=1 Tax=Rhamnella rubrinervis TaxID=2594499 RepID=A0A8K0DUX9_9ROSA|nr:hypothetical protein FNV43_RR21799 [Rhamnella rubrinervis]
MAIQAQLYSENLGFPLCGSQDWIVVDGNSGCGGTGSTDGYGQFHFNISQKQQQQQQLHMQELQNQQLHLLQQRNQNLWLENNFPVSVSKDNNSQSTTDNTTQSTSMAAYSQSIAFQVENQRQEIDQYLKVQNERLRLVLQEQRKQQIETLLKKIESKTTALLRQKDEEMAQGAKRAMELEDLLRKMEMENQSWKRVAQEKEAMVVSLNNTLEQMRERASCCLNNNGAEDAESCCDVEERENTEDEEEEEEGDSSYVEQKRLKKKGAKMVCRGCNSRSSCVLFLPCRHLCSCKACEAFLDSCPVCQTPKKASIEALIF